MQNHQLAAHQQESCMVIQKEIEERLFSSLAPGHLEVENESYMHSVPEGSESHFKVVVVSAGFEGMRPVQRHQLVYRELGDVMQKIHALALHTFTADEWSQRANVAAASPDCKGGSKAG